jgi:plastocyanin
MRPRTTNSRATRAAVGALVALAVTAPLAACGDDSDTTSDTTSDSTADSMADSAGTMDGDATVVIADVAFTNPDIAIQVGGTVTFDNQDTQAHTATGTGDSFDTDTIAAGETVTVTFDEVGTFAFVCSFHPFMKGTVVVN